MAANNGKLRDPDAQKARALMMLEHKMRTGETLPQVAEAFGVSEKTVARALALARRAKLMVEAEDRILQNLVPAAENAIAAALASTEHPIKAGELGLKLLEGMLPSLKKKQGPNGSHSAHDELESYIDAIRGQLADAVEGEVIDSPSATAASDPPKGLPAPDQPEQSGQNHAPQPSQGVGESLLDRAFNDSGD